MRRLGLVVLTFLLTACGGSSDTSGGSPGDASSGPRVPTTREALAAIALDHLSADPRSYDQAYDLPPRVVGVELRFDKDVDVVLTVGPGKAAKPLCDTGECASLPSDAGPMTLFWQYSGEDDPGMVELAIERHGEHASATLVGPAITKDPRDLDLPVSVEDLTAIVADPRFAMTTTQATVDADVPDFPSSLAG